MPKTKEIRVLIRPGDLGGYISTTDISSDRDEIIVTIDPEELGKEPHMLVDIHNSLRDLSVMILTRWLHEKRIK